MYMQIKWNFISMPDAGEPEQDIQELHFTARPVSNCGIILP